MATEHPARIAAAGPESECIEIGLADAEVLVYPAVFTANEADRLLAALRSSLDWQQEEIVIFGRRQRVPRLVAWHGDPAAVYRYSGVVHRPQPWTPALQDIRSRVELLCATRFNSVLGNLYRDGRDGMGWHADDEPELGDNPVIASVSFGAERRFRMKHRRGAAGPRTLPLPHGSVLVMRGATQHNWLHSIAKTARPVGERINLTFRSIRA